MNIYVLRHGLAGQSLAGHPAADQLRPLTSKGRKKTVKSAAAMLALGLTFDVIFTSPCLRARQTATIVADAFQARKKMALLSELNVGVPPGKLLRKLSHEPLLPENVLLVGHEPQLSGFISLLLIGTTQLSVQLKKGGLCCLSAPSLKGRRHATLEWLLTPKQMLAME